MTRGTWPPVFRPTADSWQRCAVCGLAQRVRDLDQVAPCRWICNEAIGAPLCLRLCAEIGVARFTTIPATT